MITKIKAETENFTPYTKINSKSIKDLNIRLETLKILEAYTGNNFFDPVLGDNFYGMILKAQATKGKINNQDYIKLKICYTAKETIKVKG